MEALVEEGPLVEEEPLGAFRIIKKSGKSAFLFVVYSSSVKKSSRVN